MSFGFGLGCICRSWRVCNRECLWVLTSTESCVPEFLCTWLHHLSHSALLSWVRVLAFITCLWWMHLRCTRNKRSNFDDCKLAHELQAGASTWKTQTLYRTKRNISSQKQSNRPFTGWVRKWHLLSSPGRIVTFGPQGSWWKGKCKAHGENTGDTHVFLGGCQ